MPIIGQPVSIMREKSELFAFIAWADEHQFYFRWRENDACPGNYEHILDPILRLKLTADRLPSWPPGHPHQYMGSNANPQSTE